MIENYIGKIINADCMDILKQLPDNCIDLVVTSPPYNLGNVHHTGNKRFKAYKTHNDDMPEEEYQQWQVDLLNEIFRVLKEKGSCFYNHKNRIKDGLQISPYEWLLKTKLTIKQELVWFNRSQNFDKCRFYPMTERIYWLSKGKETEFNNNINHHDLFEWKSEGTDKIFKRAFPVKMVEDIISCFPENCLVLEPFSGSGTTAIACHRLKRRFICIEKDPEYWAKSCERLKAVQAQGQLF